MLVLLALSVSACNLGAASPAPPTLVPLASATPPAPLAYSGAPQSPVLPDRIETPIANVDEEVTRLLNQVDVDRLMVHISALEGFGTRHVNSIQNDERRGIGAARRYLEEQFNLIAQTSQGRLTTFLHPFSVTLNGISTTQYNVAGIIGGTEVGAGTIVIGAHYDSIAGPDFNNPEVDAPGANDNGSGVAALLELARVMSQRSSRASVIFVAFSAEEFGRLGSKSFVSYLRERNIDIIAMINIDTIGSARDRQGNTNTDEMRVFSNGPNDVSVSRHLARTAEFISYTHDLDMKLVVEDTIDREGRYGDHFSFDEAGYRAIRFISSLEEKTNGDPTDTIQFIDPAYLLRSTRSILMVAASLADGPRAPRNLSLRQGEAVDTLVWEPVPDATGYVIALRWPGALAYTHQIELGSVTTLSWDGFRSYAGIAVAARGSTGMVGPLSEEYRVPQDIAEAR